MFVVRADARFAGDTQRTCRVVDNPSRMDPQQRAALLGLLAGVAHTVVRVFVSQTVTAGPGGPSTALLAVSLVTTALSLAVIPGIPLYGAWTMDADAAPSRTRTRLAAVVGVATGVGVAASYPVLTAVTVGARFEEALLIRLVGPYLVNAVGPAVHSGVAALAGFLLAARGTDSGTTHPERKA